MTTPQEANGFIPAFERGIEEMIQVKDNSGQTQTIVGPGVFDIGDMTERERRLWKTIARKVGDGWVCFPGWNSRIAFSIDIPFADWSHGRAHVASIKASKTWGDSSSHRKR